MFDDYRYLKSRLDKFPEIKAIYRVRSRFSLDELVADVREVQFPCIAVEVNNDGILDLSAGIFDRSFHTFHVLLQTPTDRNPPADEIDATTAAGRRIGRQVMWQMKRESGDYKGACYGLDASNIQYSNIGPVGMQCYGCTFNFTMTRDHVDE